MRKSLPDVAQSFGGSMTILLEEIKAESLADHVHFPRGLAREDSAPEPEAALRFKPASWQARAG